MKTAVTEVRPQVEYPEQDETIISPHYTIRVNAGHEADGVDVSIDQGPWHRCRPASGFWWYDWSGYQNGEHSIIARTRGENGRWIMSAPQEFVVETNN